MTVRSDSGLRVPSAKLRERSRPLEEAGICFKSFFLKQKKAQEAPIGREVVNKVSFDIFFKHYNDLYAWRKPYW